MLIKISKTTYFPHSNHPLMDIGLRQVIRNLKMKEIKITTQKKKSSYIHHNFS